MALDRWLRANHQRHRVSGNAARHPRAPQLEPLEPRVLLAALDFGDAPGPYPTLLASNGARHNVVSGYFLGALIDTESDGLPNLTATGDDLAGLDDEDGVVFNTSLFPGGLAKVTVTASAAGKLDAWIDFNGDGDWGDPGEKIFNSVSLSAGANALTFTVPVAAIVSATGATTFARFRFSSAGGLTVLGEAPDGEVEDYQVKIFPYWTNQGAIISQIGQNCGGNKFAMPDVLVDVDLPHTPVDPAKAGTLEPATGSLQAAVDYLNAVGDVNGDGCLLIAVTAKDAFSTVTCQGVTFVGRLPGGEGAENVLITNASPKRLNVFANSVTLAAADPAKPVITVENSLGKVTALSLHVRGSNVAGYLVANNGDLVVVKSARAFDNSGGVGIWVQDNDVEISGSPEISGNAVGVKVEGNNVTLRGNSAIVSNGWGGQIEGNNNLVNDCKIGLAGKPNGDGMWIFGSRNTVKGGSVSYNMAGSGFGLALLGDFNRVEGVDILGNVWGLTMLGNNNLISGNAIMSNSGDAVRLSGNGNLIRGNKVGEKSKGNGLSGIRVSGNNNTVRDNSIFANGWTGLDVSGDDNVLIKNIVGDKNKGGNARSGIVVTGRNNLLQENTANANKGYGIWIAGMSSTGNKLKSNRSNTDSAGGGNRNLLGQYRFDAPVIDLGGNRKDNMPFLSLGGIYPPGVYCSPIA